MRGSGISRFAGTDRSLQVWTDSRRCFWRLPIMLPTQYRQKLRRLRNLTFVVLILVWLAGGQKVNAFGCNAIYYYNYGAYFWDCGEHAGEWTGCGFLTNDCQYLCYPWSGHLEWCSPQLIDEMSDLWVTDAQCDCVQ